MCLPISCYRSKFRSKTIRASKRYDEDFYVWCNNSCSSFMDTINVTATRPATARACVARCFQTSPCRTPTTRPRTSCPSRKPILTSSFMNKLFSEGKMKKGLISPDRGPAPPRRRHLLLHPRLHGRRHVPAIFVRFMVFMAIGCGCGRLRTFSMN